MAHDPKLVEAMAQAIAAPAFDPFRKAEMNMPHLVQARKFAMNNAERALTTLCAARPDVAALLSGKAVAVPMEAVRHIERLPDGAPQTSIEALQWISAAMEAHRMISASPYTND